MPIGPNTAQTLEEKLRSMQRRMAASASQMKIGPAKMNFCSNCTVFGCVELDPNIPNLARGNTGGLFTSNSVRRLLPLANFASSKMVVTLFRILLLRLTKLRLRQRMAKASMSKLFYTKVSSQLNQLQQEAKQWGLMALSRKTVYPKHWHQL